MAYRMTPARRAALRRAQAASARKRKGSGRGKVRSAKSVRRRQRVKSFAQGAGLAAVAAGTYAGLAAHEHHQKTKRSKRAHARNRASNDRIIRRHTGTSTRTVHGARAHGGGPTHSNRVFVTSKHGTTSVRRRHH